MLKRKAAHEASTRNTRHRLARRAATPSTVIDHLAFPHIMETIIAALDYTTLGSLGRTCRKYYDQFYLGPHCIVTAKGTELAVAPFHDPGATRVPAAFRDDFQYLTRRKVDQDTWLGRLGVVDLKFDNVPYSFLPNVSDENKAKLAGLLKPIVVRMKTFLPVNAKVAIYICNYAPKYDHGMERWATVDWHNGTCIRSSQPDRSGTPLSNPPDKIVLAVQYSPIRGALFPGRDPLFGTLFVIACNEPIVVHFVKLNEPPLNPMTPEAPVGDRFGADHAFGVIQSVAFFLSSSRKITVVGLETISPWQFEFLKAETAHLELSREQQICHLLANDPNLWRWHQHNRSSDNLNIRFLTVEEYAKEVSPVMLALERGEGFTFT